MDLSFVSGGIIIALALTLLIFAGVGALRGLIKTSVSLVGNIIAAVLAVVLTPIIINSDAANTAGGMELVKELLPENFQNNADIERLLNTISLMVGAIVLFIVLYVVLFFLLKIPQIFVNMAIKKASSRQTEEVTEGGEVKTVETVVLQKKLSPVMRLTGALVGVVNGLLFFVVFYSVVAGLLFTATGITGEFVEDVTKKPIKNKDYAEMVDTVKETNEMIKPLASDPVLKMVNTLGGKAIYNHVTTVKNDDKKVNLDTQANQLYYTAMAALRAGDLMSSDLTDKLAGLFNKPGKPNNGGSTGGNTEGGNTTGGNTESGSTGGNTEGGSAGGNTEGGSTGGNTEGGTVLPPITEETTFEEVMNDPEIKETMDTLAEALTKVDDFTAVISKDTVNQIMEETGANISEISEEDKDMVKDYVNEYIDNFECTPEEKDKLESNIQDLLNLIGIDIDLSKFN